MLWLNACSLLTLWQGWANYGLWAACSPPCNFLRPTDNFSELAQVVDGILILGFAFSLQKIVHR